jgi:pyruvate dehydrogenase E1 component alpha subunit
LSDEAFETYELDPPPYTLNTTKAELKKIYYDMVAVRYDFLHLPHSPNSAAT